MLKPPHKGMMLKLKRQYLATSCEVLTHWKRLWCWEGLGTGGEGGDRGWDGWMASLTQWTWIWVNSGSLWWTGRPGVLRFMGSQRVGHNWATELNWHMHMVSYVLPRWHSGEELRFRIILLKVRTWSWMDSALILQLRSGIFFLSSCMAHNHTLILYQIWNHSWLAICVGTPGIHWGLESP